MRDASIFSCVRYVLSKCFLSYNILITLFYEIIRRGTTL